MGALTLRLHRPKGALTLRLHRLRASRDKCRRLGRAQSTNAREHHAKTRDTRQSRRRRAKQQRPRRRRREPQETSARDHWGDYTKLQFCKAAKPPVIGAEPRLYKMRCRFVPVRACNRPCARRAHKARGITRALGGGGGGSQHQQHQKKLTASTIEAAAAGWDARRDGSRPRDQRAQSGGGARRRSEATEGSATSARSGAKRRDVRRAPRDGDAIVRAVVRSGRHAQANKGGAAAARFEGKRMARTHARMHANI